MYLSMKGRGKPMLLLHGFGFNHQCFEQLTECISNKYQCFAPDLPGFGRSQYKPYTLDSLLAYLHDILPEKISILGWSLGGTIGLAYANKYPNNITELLMVGCNPYFIEEKRWPGMNAQAFHFFSKLCKRDYQKAQQIFLDLQKAVRTQGALPVAYKNALDTQASTQAAGNALEILEQTDLRRAYEKLKVPGLTLVGRYDQLVPISITQSLLKLNPNIPVNIFEHSAHAPFITEQEKFISLMDAFLCKT